METAEVTLHFDKVCRVCLTESEEMHSLFSQITQEDCAEDESCYLYQILMSISSMKVRSYLINNLINKKQIKNCFAD